MKNVFFYCSFLVFLACGNGLENVEIVEDDGSVTHYTRKKDNFAKEGLLTRMDQAGTKIEEAHYQNDTLHGERRLYYETGELHIIENHDHGIFKGPYQMFHKNGQLKFEAQYQQGTLEGKGQSYYEDGQLKEVVTFDNNEENGPFEEYHPNGKIKARGEYLGGDNEHGLLEIFDETGELIKKMQCAKGICRTSWEKGQPDTGSADI
ncbi:MAG: toxin-antitoxin system YwqK family antitoxin [Bacteroidota bacterium]